MKQASNNFTRRVLQKATSATPKNNVRRFADKAANNNEKALEEVIKKDINHKSLLASSEVLKHENAWQGQSQNSTKFKFNEQKEKAWASKTSSKKAYDGFSAILGVLPAINVGVSIALAKSIYDEKQRRKEQEEIKVENDNKEPSSQIANQNLKSQESTDPQTKKNDNSNSGRLLEAVLSNDLTEIRRISENGQEVNERFKSSESNNTTALHAATEAKNTAAMKLLLKNGADVNAESTFFCENDDDTKATGVTPIHIAAEHTSPDAVNILLENGANIKAEFNASNKDRKTTGITPLHDATQENDTDSINALAANGANFNATTSEGKTALCIAIDNDRIDTAMIIRKAGGNVGNEKNLQLN